MKVFYISLIGFLLMMGYKSYSQNAKVIDLHDAVKNNNIDVFNRKLTLLNEESHAGIRLSKDYGEGVAWLKGIDFSNGIIEFDVRGEDVKQHSFVGVAFHGINDSTYDAIYLRPFQFRAQDEALKNHSIQYISLPNFTWRVLRAQFPNKYENAIKQDLDPNSWVRVRIEIKDATVSVYINGSKEASLTVQKVTNISTGLIGFYVADTSGGDFANITITKTN
ncbi:MAG: family 16 glycoside hydrolase [Bacteroidia bacterium]